MYRSFMHFANAFSTDAGRCYRWVYETGTTRPMRCIGKVTARGWWQDNGGAWWVVDACPEHAHDFSDGRPGPGERLGKSWAVGDGPCQVPGHCVRLPGLRGTTAV